MKVNPLKPFFKKKAIFIASLLTGILLLIISIFLAFAFQVDISSLEHPLPMPLVIYDKNDVIVSERSTVNFTAVPLAMVPDIFTTSLIAVEDQRFYKHSGIDFRAILRSAWRNLVAGAVVEGGSTLTQQLAKNMFLTSERTYTRKFTEAITAIRIEGKYSKEDILELYINQIYFGEGVWGIQNAAQMYFGKNIQDVTLDEAALLAGLPKSPTHYSPFKNSEKSKERRDLVLKLLYDQGHIKKEEYEQAISREIVLRDRDLAVEVAAFPSYVDYVISEAINDLGLEEEYVLIGGLNIYTNLDPAVQLAMESTYANAALFPESSEKELIQSAAIAIDPSTGGIRGLIGQRGKYYYRGFNRATELKRQPGSSLKPLAVYGPALENGYHRNSVLMDEPTDFNGYIPVNYNGTCQGKLSLYEALIHSINIPAVALLDDIGLKKGFAFLEKAGIPLHKKDQNLSIALGGMTEGVSPLHMAQAFSLFPNGGVMNKAYAIRKITSPAGEIIKEVAVHGTIVMEPQNAYAMTEMLVGVVEEGTGKNAALGRPTGGKTGTTQLPSIDAFSGIDGARDAWFIGFTPELVTAVWVGYDTLDPSLIMQSTGGNHPAKIFQAIMLKALENTSVSAFVKPEGYKDAVKPEKENGNPSGGKKKKKKN
jgi:penicillin-binding protein 2A